MEKDETGYGIGYEKKYTSQLKKLSRLHEQIIMLFISKQKCKVGAESYYTFTVLKYDLH